MHRSSEHEGSFDVVFLQEIWFRKDYVSLSDCVASHYITSEFDDECGKIKGGTTVWFGCSGLVTMVAKKDSNIMNEDWHKLPKGTDYASIQDAKLYFNYVLTKKALVHDVEVSH